MALPTLDPGAGNTKPARLRAYAGVTTIDDMAALAVGLRASMRQAVVLMHRYLGGLMDPFVTLLEVHKLRFHAVHPDDYPIVNLIVEEA